jgi:hypothetical protein
MLNSANGLFQEAVSLAMTMVVAITGVTFKKADNAEKKAIAVEAKIDGIDNKIDMVLEHILNKK